MNVFPDQQRRNSVPFNDPETPEGSCVKEVMKSEVKEEKIEKSVDVELEAPLTND